MDIMELGAIGELVGGVAVVGSLLYVGFQVRHNTRAVEVGAHNDLLQLAATIESLVASDAELAEIELRGASRPDELSDVEWRRFKGYAMLSFAYWEGAFLHQAKDMIDAEMWTAWDGAARLILSGIGYQRVWSEVSSAYAPTFQDYVNRKALASGS